MTEIDEIAEIDELAEKIEQSVMYETRPDWINPVEGTITSLFGMRVNPVTQQQEFHNGLDIAVMVGTPVLAVRCATVYHASYSRINGYYMRLRCDEGYHFVYAHLSEILANVNDRVSQGDKVALSGNSGRSTGPHLHFGITQNGQMLDPLRRVTDLPMSYNARMEYANRRPGPGAASR